LIQAKVIEITTGVRIGPKREKFIFATLSSDVERSGHCRVSTISYKGADLQNNDKGVARERYKGDKRVTNEITKYKSTRLIMARMGTEKRMLTQEENFTLKEHTSCQDVGPCGIVARR